MSMTVGLTGGIGSGKTMVGEVFRYLGTPVFKADDAGRILLDTDPEVIHKVGALFGGEVYRKGYLDRSIIAHEVFRDADLLSKLNEIIHPRVRQAFEEWVDERSSDPYVIMEAAIIFESGSDQYLDAVIAVSAPEDLRIQRVVERDRVEAESVKIRIRNQWPEASILRKADYVIFNDGTQLVLPQVLRIHELLMEKQAAQTGD